MAKRIALALLLLGIAGAAAAADVPKDNVPILTQEVFEAAARATVEAHLLDVDAGAMTLNTRFGRIHFAYLPLLAPLPYSFGSRNWNQVPNALVLTGTDIPLRHYKPRDPLAEIDVRPDDDN